MINTWSKTVGLFLFLVSSAFSQQLVPLKSLTFERNIQEIYFPKHNSSNTPFVVLSNREIGYQEEPDMLTMEASPSLPTTQTEPQPEPSYLLQLPSGKKITISKGEYISFLSDSILFTESSLKKQVKKYRIKENNIIAIDSISYFLLGESYTARIISSQASVYLFIEYYGSKKLDKRPSIICYNINLKEVYRYYRTNPSARPWFELKGNDSLLFLEADKAEMKMYFSCYHISSASLFKKEIRLDFSPSEFDHLGCFLSDSSLLIPINHYYNTNCSIRKYNLNNDNMLWEVKLNYYLLHGISFFPSKGLFTFNEIKAYIEKKPLSKTHIYDLTNGTLKSSFLLPNYFKDVVNKYSPIDYFIYNSYQEPTLVGNGKWLASILNCYSPINFAIQSNKLFISDGITAKCFPLLSKELEMPHIIVLEKNQLAVLLNNKVQIYELKD